MRFILVQQLNQLALSLSAVHQPDDPCARWLYVEELNPKVISTTKYGRRGNEVSISIQFYFPYTTDTNFLTLDIIYVKLAALFSDYYAL
jgi:hypothetical protein